MTISKQETRRASSGAGSSSSGISSTSNTANAIERSLRQQANATTFSPIPSPFKCFLNALSRRKPLDCRTDTNLNRCLNMLDLTALGVGSTLGLGLYVLAGQVASKKAGPGVVISFAMAAIASAFSALCYAEFAGRVPKAGSAFSYSYISTGEFAAFIIGWNLILEYVIGCSSVARGFSEYLRTVFSLILKHTDNLDNPSTLSPHHQQTNNHLNENNYTLGISQQHNYQMKTMSKLLNYSLVNTSSSNLAAITNASSSNPTILVAIWDHLVKYFDWPSVVIITLVTIMILFGVKESTNFTIFFTSINLSVVLIVLISSFNKLNLHNWSLEEYEVPKGHGRGGFLPYGWSGVMAGSATCFFAFIGFDTIASSAEEAKNPKKNVPISIILSLFISFLAYMSIATIQTLLWPYYDQDKATILPIIFGRLNMPIVHWIVLIGAVAGLASSQLGGMYPLPRILYSMAKDKLIYSYLAHINGSLKLPVRATIVGSVLIAVLSCLLDIEALADMVSIGTLAAYSLVSISVLILRYENKQNVIDDSTILNNNLNHLTFNEILNTMEQSTIDSSISLKFNEDSYDNNTTINTKETPLDDDQFNETTFDSKTTTTVRSSKQKLGPKASIPIREKGSRPLVAQLSVGFNSWFKNQELDKSNSGQLTSLQMDSVTQSRTASPWPNKQFGYLDLLISWKADEHLRQPDDRSSRQSKILISILILLTILLDVSAILMMRQPEWLSLQKDPLVDPLIILNAFGCIVLVSLVAVMLMLSRLPTRKESSESEMFQVPLVPLIPTLSILVNTLLMLNLSYLTWIRFTVWMSIGFFIYFTYGIWNSVGYLLHYDG